MARRFFHRFAGSGAGWPVPPLDSSVALEHRVPKRVLGDPFVAKSNRTHRQNASSKDRMPLARSVEPVAVIPPSPGLNLSIAGHTLSVADVAMMLSVVAWLVFIIVVARRSDLIASDDAFISFQYARNLGLGHGLVFNPGERVWGFTSPLQTLVLGVLTACGLETIRTAFLTAFLWVAIGAVLLYRLSFQFLSRMAALLLALFYLLDRAQHGSYGLESNLLIATQLSFLLASTAKKGALANVFAALSCLVRPDSLLLVGPILLLGSETRRPRNLAWFIGLGLLWECFAVLYYGEFVPNSYHAKIGLTRFGPFLKGALESVTGLTFSERLGFAPQPSLIQRLIVFVLSLSPILNRGIRRRPVILYALVLYPLVLVAAYSAIGSYPGHNWEFHSARFFLRISAVVGFLSLCTIVAEKWNLPVIVRRLMALAALVFVLTNGVFQTEALATSLTTKNTSYWGGARNTTYRSIANWVNRNAPAGATVAISEVGTFAYYSNTHVIDVSGIVTRGYNPSERMNHGKFMLRFAPSYAVVYGDQREMVLSPTLRYERVVYFPKQGFSDFSLLTKR